MSLPSNHFDDNGFSFIVVMLMIPCSLANHFISRKDVGIRQPASLSSITQLKLVGYRHISNEKGYQFDNWYCLNYDIITNRTFV